MTFKETGLKPELLSAIEKMGFVEPTPIQQETIPFILENKTDLIALAQTGTGKTAAFSLPVLSKINLNDKNVQLLILCPTRELCLQIAKDIENYTNDLRALKTLAVYGGTSIVPQKKQLKRGVHVVVGTPGRTLDLIRQGALNVRNIEWLTLDEADEMLNMGFQDDLEAILKDTPDDKQTLLFSATMPKTIKGMVNKFMTDPHRIAVAKQNIGASKVEHHYYVVKAKDRYKALQRLVDANPDMYAIIFCRTRRETQEIANKLMEAGYNADTIHGDLSQAQRDSVMKSFKKKSIQILVATDVAARGIDVDVLTHVINYQLPDDPEVYVHRSGRTGRAGNTGISICLINTREGRRLNSIERMIGKEFIKKEIPSGQEITDIRIKDFIKTIKEFETKRNVLEDYWPIIEAEIGDLGSDEIINRLLTIEISRFLETYENAPNLNASASRERNDRDDDRGGRRERKRSGNWVGYEVASGSKERMQPKRLISIINEATDSSDVPIGDIMVKTNTTYFEVDAEHAKRLEEAFDGMEVHGEQFLTRQETRPTPTQRSRRSNSGGGRDRRSSGGSGGGRSRSSSNSRSSSRRSGGGYREEGNSRRSGGNGGRRKRD